MLVNSIIEKQNANITMFPGFPSDFYQPDWKVEQLIRILLSGLIVYWESFKTERSNFNSQNKKSLYSELDITVHSCVFS